MIDSILVKNKEALKRTNSEIQKSQLEKKEDSQADSIRIIDEHSNSIKRLDTEIARLEKVQQTVVEPKEAPESTVDKEN
jgi:hypothetical protein